MSKPVIPMSRLENNNANSLVLGGIFVFCTPFVFNVFDIGSVLLNYLLWSVGFFLFLAGMVVYIAENF